MRWLRFLALACLLSGPSAAQVGQIPAWPPTQVVSGGCSQATTFLARTSGLDATHTTAYTNMICGLVTDGVWSQLDALYIFATADSTTAGLNLVSTSFGMTTGGTTTFTADRGYAGNGTTGFLNTNFTPSTAGGHYVNNSASFGVYDRTTRAVDTSFQMGVYSSTGSPRNYQQNFHGANLLDTTINSGFPGASISNAGSAGFFATNRTAASTVPVYKNGSILGTNTDTSLGLPDNPFYIGALNNNGTAASFSTDQIAAAFIGAGFNSTQNASLSSRINAYMTAVGANVF